LAPQEARIKKMEKNGQGIPTNGPHKEKGVFGNEIGKKAA